MTEEADCAAGGSSTAMATTKQYPPQKLSKRQLRKKENEKNKWLIQHPKIQSMNVRNKLYVKDAGLTLTKAERENRAATIDPDLDLMSPEVKFGRLLGGTDQRKRHAAVKKLKAYLTARCQVRVVDSDNNSKSYQANFVGGLSELDLLKLWKALWYTLYMADKKPVQDELSKHLAQLIWCVAGTEEDDEYAAQAYLAMMAEEEEEDNDDDDDDDDEDDPDVTLEEIENTLDQDDDDDEASEEDSEEGSDEDRDSNDGDDSDDMEDPSADDEDSMDDVQVPHCRGAHLASLFIRTFFRTVRRDWDKMDKYRVDKFYTLIRVMMHEVYKYMALRHWNFGIIRLFNDAIFEEILSQKPNGLRYHLIDLSLEELAKVNSKAPLPLTEATFLDVLEPYLAMCQSGAGDDTVQSRVMDRVLDTFLDTYSVVSDNAIRLLEDESSADGDDDNENKGHDDDDDSNEDEKSVVLDQVHVGTIAEFIFSLASDPETNDKYRKPLYDMHKKYMRRLKQIGRDVEMEEDQEELDEEDLDRLEMAMDAEGKSSGKKRKAMDDAEDEGQVDESTEAVTKNEKKKRKKKNKKHDNRPAEANEQQNTQEEEEEVVISLSEQKEAKKVDKEKKRKKKDKNKKASDDAENKRATPGSSSKRVKFDKVNRTKSHKASMKALVTATPPKTKDVTPEKGILRKGRHGSKSTSVLSKKGRKKAVNYF